MRFYETFAQPVILEEERKVELGERAGTN